MSVQNTIENSKYRSDITRLRVEMAGKVFGKALDIGADIICLCKGNVKAVIKKRAVFSIGAVQGITVHIKKLHIHPPEKMRRQYDLRLRSYRCACHRLFRLYQNAAGASGHSAPYIPSLL